MSGDNLKLKYPGLIRSPMPSGNVRWLVRVEGDPKKRITLTVDPEHPEFHEIYVAARSGIKKAPDLKVQSAQTGTLGWLGSSYLKHLEKAVENGDASRLTLKQRENLMPGFLAHTSQTGRSVGKSYATLPVDIPPHELVLFRDSLMATPGKATNTFKMLKAMFKWALDRKYTQTNPAAAIKVNYVSKGGAKPWTLDDLEKFRKAHPKGTMAHLTLTLFMFTACRISEAHKLGRANEVKKGGVTWLEWQPSKKNAQFVSLPVLPPLAQAIKAQTVIGETYLLNQSGKPFGSAETLRNSMQTWCKEAGLTGLSSHGIRKAAGHLMALHGATQYEIMAVHGHANASSSEVYTKGVERQRLAERANSRLASIDW